MQKISSLPSKAVVAERLRRLTRNQIPSGSAGSNPADCELFSAQGTTGNLNQQSKLYLLGQINNDDSQQNFRHTVYNSTFHNQILDTCWLGSALMTKERFYCRHAFLSVWTPVCLSACLHASLPSCIPAFIYTSCPACIDA